MNHIEELAAAARSYTLSKTQLYALQKANTSLPKKKREVLEDAISKALVRYKNAESKYLALEKKYGKEFTNAQ